MTLTMKNYKPENFGIKSFQQGGEIPEQPADETQNVPVEGQPSPEQQIIEAAVQALQTQDCNIAMQVCQVLVQMAQGAGAEQGQPVYKKGGKLVRFIKR